MHSVGKRRRKSFYSNDTGRHSPSPSDGNSYTEEEEKEKQAEDLCKTMERTCCNQKSPSNFSSHITH